MKYFLYIALLFFCLLSCQNKNRELEGMLNDWIDKEILFPENLNFSIQGKVASDFSIHDSEYKIVAYVDSMGCTSCKLQLSGWKNYINSMDSIQPNKVQFLFFFFPKNGRDIYFTLRAEKFKYPICIDTLDVLNKLNHFPSDMQFQTFLLDKNNKVMAIGNPIQNPNIKELYQNIISGESSVLSTEKKLQTSMVLDKVFNDLGTFNCDQEQHVEFKLTNTGNELLVIDDIATSCGCTTVEYTKEPVQKGKNLTLKVKYKADHPEHFNKTITVYCNTKDSPLQLKISGNAK